VVESVNFRDYLPDPVNTEDLTLRENLAVEQNDFATNALREATTRFDANTDYFGAATRAIFGDRPGAKAAADLAKSKEELAAVYRNANEIKDFETLLDSGDASDWGRYFVHSAINIGPEVAATAASAVSSGFVAPLLFNMGKSAAKDAAKDIAKDRFVTRASQIAGAYAVNAPQRIGETYGFTGDAGASFLSGGIQGAVDLFADVAVLRALGKAAKGPARDQATSALREITAGAARQAGIEGGTEAIQNELQLLAKVYADPEFDYTGDKANLQRLESAITGTVLGAGTGGTVTGVGRSVSGGQSALTQFREGAREAETEFVPETDAQIETQLLELRQGRGREAVVKTDGPLRSRRNHHPRRSGYRRDTGRF